MIAIFDTELTRAGRIKLPCDCKIPTRTYAAAVNIIIGNITESSFAPRAAASGLRLGAKTESICPENTEPITATVAEAISASVKKDDEKARADRSPSDSFSL